MSGGNAAGELLAQPGGGSPDVARDGGRDGCGGGGDRPGEARVLRRVVGGEERDGRRERQPTRGGRRKRGCGWLLEAWLREEGACFAETPLE